MDSSIEVVGLGALNADHIYRVESILGDGETIVKEAMVSPGGSSANTIYGLAKLGVKSGFIGAVGDDAEGKLLLNDFQGIGVDTTRINVKHHAATGSTLCLSDNQDRRSIYVLPRANNLLTMEDIDPGYINRARILHLTSFVDDQQFQVLLALIAKLVPPLMLSFSPGALYATKGMEALTPILSRTDVLFLNRDEIEQLSGQDVAAGAETCLKQGCRIVAVTLGKGIRWGKTLATSYIRATDNEYIIEARERKPTDVLDTTGAGDAYATGFLYGLLKGMGIRECGYLADITARLSTAEIGARQGLPTAKTLSRYYREIYQ